MARPGLLGVDDPDLRAAISGVTASLVFPGATDTATFENYVEQVLVPQLKPGDVVIWDNLQPHKAESVVPAVEAAKARSFPCRRRVRI